MVPSLGGVVSFGTATAGYFEGEIWTRLSEGETTLSTFTSVSRLEDGLPVAAVFVPDSQDCFVIGTNGKAPFLVPMFAPSGLLVEHVIPGRPAEWRSGAVPFELEPMWTQSTVFDDCGTSGAWGATFIDGRVAVVASRDATDWTVIEAPGTEQSHVSAAGNGWLVYLRWKVPEMKRFLKSYRFDTGESRQIFEGQDQVTMVAMSEDTLAWVGVDGPNWRTGTYESVRYYWAPVASLADELEVVEGPSIPVPSAAKNLDVAGDWVAGEGCIVLPDATGDCRMVLVRRSTQEIFCLKAPEGVIWHLLALEPDAVVLAEYEVASDIPGPAMTHLRRIESRSYSEWHVPF